MCFDPLDGSSNIDCLVSIGTIFAIYKKVCQFLLLLHMDNSLDLFIYLFILETPLQVSISRIKSLFSVVESIFTQIIYLSAIIKYRKNTK